MKNLAEIRNENLVNALRDLDIDPVTFAAFLEAQTKVSDAARKLLKEIGITPKVTRGCLHVQVQVSFGELMTCYNSQTDEQAERGTNEANLVMSILNPKRMQYNAMAVMK